MEAIHLKSPPTSPVNRLQIASPRLSIESWRLDHAPIMVSDCFSIKFANFPHSLLIVWKAFSTSANQIFPADTISLILLSATPIFFASSWMIGTPALINCLRSFPTSLPADFTCP